MSIMKSTRNMTAFSAAAPTAGPTCRASISICLSPVKRNSDDCTRPYALFCRSFPRWLPLRPISTGRWTGLLDARMQHYRYNSMAIPAMTGDLVPEAVFTPDAYRTHILEPIYAQSAPLDPMGILRDEWANARGAIARFDRSAIEIRVTDSQECPSADLAVCFAVAGAVRLLTGETLASWEEQKRWSVARLYRLFFDAVRGAEHAPVLDPEYAALFGLPRKEISFGEIWAALLDRPELQSPLFKPWFDLYRERGPLARRLVERAGLTPSRPALRGICDDLCACLAEKTFFV